MDTRVSVHIIPGILWFDPCQGTGQLSSPSSLSFYNYVLNKDKYKEGDEQDLKCKYSHK